MIAAIVILTVIVLCVVVLIILLGANETKLRRVAEEPVISPFEAHQERVREARRRAEWRSRQRTIETERERL